MWYKKICILLIRQWRNNSILLFIAIILNGSFHLYKLNMKSQVFIFSLCILLGVALQASESKTCPLHERFVECIDFCNTCESDGRACILICIPGCDCIPGYTRNYAGYCIPRRFCNVSVEIDNYGCPDVTKCSKSCSTRGFKSGKCIGPQFRKCQCQCQVDKPTVLNDEQDRGCPNERICRRSCELRGFISGKCTGKNRTICTCEELEVEPPTSEVAQTAACPHIHKCVASCQRLGFSTGRCEGIDCRCLNPNSLQCNDDTCDSSCTARGFRSGVCVGPKNVCRCYK